VSCTVMAVITDNGWQPMLASVKMSACKPAPPDGSVAANVSTAGGDLRRSGIGDIKGRFGINEDKFL